MPRGSCCTVGAVSDEATVVQVTINTSTLYKVNHQTGEEVKGADESHQKNQRAEQVEAVEAS